MKTRDAADVLGLALVLILLFLIFCYVAINVVDRSSRNENQAHQQPFQQEIPFKK